MARRRRRQDREPGRRRSRPPGGHHEAGTDDDPYFLNYNANKKSVTVNLKSPRGLDARQGAGEARPTSSSRTWRPARSSAWGSATTSSRKLNPGIIYGQVKGFGDGQPVREEPRLRHDRAGLRRHDEHHRRARRPPDQAGPDARRHRHRHADGDQHPGRALQAQAHRQGRAAAGGDAGRDAALHPQRASAHQARTGKPAPRAGAQALGGNNPPCGIYPVHAGRPERLRLRLYQPRQPGALAAAARS